jgi:hypothetical protein
MGGNPITNEVAAAALKKLEAIDVTRKNCPHPTFSIFFQDRVVATTGLRRASNKDISLPHVKRDLRVPAHFVLDLARCPKSREDWLQEVGLMPRRTEPQTGESEPQTS